MFCVYYVREICMDNPLRYFKLLAKELCLKYITLPDFVLTATMNIAQSTVKEKGGLDLEK